MRKNQVMMDVERYNGTVMHEATSNDLQLNAENMQRYIIGPTTLRLVLRIL